MKTLTLLIISLAAAIGQTAVAADAARSYSLAPGADPKTSAPYSSGVMVGGTFYVSGHLGIDAATGKVAADAEAEARSVLDAVKQTLERAGLTMDDLVSVTVYCTDLDLYDKFNAVYRGYFHEHYPSRTFIGAAKLVRGARFEVAGIAVKSAPSVNRN
jgi:2-iminobutanoate/2-iminopropanoate deaminase